MTRSVLHQAWAALSRPVLMRPEAADLVAQRLTMADPRGHAQRPGLMARLGRWTAGLASRPTVMEEDAPGGGEPLRPMAWSPNWLGATEEIADGAVSLTSDGVAVFAIDSELVEDGGWVCGEYVWGYRQIQTVMEELDADARVRGIFVRIDSPGGIVSPALDDLSAMLRARHGRGAAPLWVHAETACSAAYWIAAQADRILAPAGGTVGSIGVVMVHVEQSAAIERAGYVVTPVTFGAAKVDGAPWAPLGDAMRDRLQAEIDDIGARFVAAVSAGRGLQDVSIRRQEAMVFHAAASRPDRDAMVAGLVDDVLPERRAYAALVASLVLPAVGVARPAANTLSTHSTPETDMNTTAARARAFLKTERASAMTPQEKLESIQAILDEEDTPEAEDEDPAAEGDEPDPAVEGDDDEAPTAGAALRTAQAILDLPEAKGREKLARALAFDGKSVKEARRFLAAAPKASALADRMEGRDSGVSNASYRPGAPSASNEAEAYADEVLAARKRVTGR